MCFYTVYKMTIRPIRKTGFFYTDSGPSSCIVWAPQAKSVQLHLLSTPGRQINMEKDALGYWSVEVEDVVPGIAYQFRLDNSGFYADPASFSQPRGVHGASAVYDNSYKYWRDENWMGIPLSDLIIYEIHTGAFCSEGNFSGIIQQIPHLKTLGITAIELMPVAQFAGIHNWGYDGVLPNAVQYSYGGPDALKDLVNAAHEAGIAIILDVVYNHFGPEGNVSGAFAPYTTGKHSTPWSAAINLDDQYSYGVRDFFIGNALMWLEDFHIDGLRVDAAHALIDNSAIHFLEELDKQVLAVEETTGRKKLLIIEMDGNNPRYITSSTLGGYNLDAQWNDEFHHALHALLTGEREGYYQDFGTINDLAKAYTHTYVFDGQFSSLRKKFIGRPTTNAFSQFIVFAQNHDHIGNRIFGERNSVLLSFEQNKLAAAAVLLSPYTPLLFMGEEYGEQKPFLYFTDFADVALAASVNEGRKKEFAHFNWPADPPHSQAYNTFTDCVLSWDEKQGRQAELLEFYKALIQLRKSHEALQTTGREGMNVEVIDAGIIVMKRFRGGSELIILLNFTNTLFNFFNTDTSYKILLDADDEIFGGAQKEKGKRKGHGETIPLKGYSVIVLEKENN